MMRENERKNSILGKALAEYMKGNFSKCEFLLEKAKEEGDEEATKLLARLYYELGSPYKAACIVREVDEEMADIYEKMAERGKIERIMGRDTTIEEDYLLKCGIYGNILILPVDKKERCAVLEDLGIGRPE